MPVHRPQQSDACYCCGYLVPGMWHFSSNEPYASPTKIVHLPGQADGMLMYNIGTDIFVPGV